MTRRAGRGRADLHEDPVGHVEEGIGPGDRQAGAQRQLGRGDREAVQRAQQRYLGGARVRGAVQALQGRVQPLLAQREVALLGEDVPQQGAQRRVHSLGTPPPRPPAQLRPPAAFGERLTREQVAIQALEARQRSRGARVALEAPQRAPALAQEDLRQRAVAVQRGAPPPRGTRGQLEGHLRAGVQVGLHEGGRLPHELGERRLQLG